MAGELVAVAAGQPLCACFRFEALRAVTVDGPVRCLCAHCLCEIAQAGDRLTMGPIRRRRREVPTDPICPDRFRGHRLDAGSTFQLRPDSPQRRELGHKMSECHDRQLTMPSQRRHQKGRQENSAAGNLKEKIAIGNKSQPEIRRDWVVAMTSSPCRSMRLTGRGKPPRRRRGARRRRHRADGRLRRGRRIRAGRRLRRGCGPSFETTAVPGLVGYANGPTRE